MGHVVPGVILGIAIGVMLGVGAYTFIYARGYVTLTNPLLFFVATIRINARH
jgi:hypothetical protein